MNWGHFWFHLPVVSCSRGILGQEIFLNFPPSPWEPGEGDFFVFKPCGKNLSNLESFCAWGIARNPDRWDLDLLTKMWSWDFGVPFVKSKFQRLWFKIRGGNSLFPGGWEFLLGWEYFSVFIEIQEGSVEFCNPGHSLVLWEQETFSIRGGEKMGMCL